MTRSLAVMALTPEASASPAYHGLVAALRARFGARNVTDIGALADVTALRGRQALIVYLDGAPPPAFWATHPERAAILREAEQQHLLTIPLAAEASVMPAQPALPADLAPFARKQLLEPERVARGDWGHLAERIADLLAIQYDFGWARFVVWVSSAAPFAAALLFSLILEFYPHIVRVAYAYAGNYGRGTMNDYLVALLKLEPAFPQLMAVVFSPFILVLALWHMQALQLRRWNTLTRFVIADGLLLAGTAIFFIDWAQGYHQGFNDAFNYDTYTRNLWLFGLLLSAGVILAVSSFVEMSSQIVRPVQDTDLVHLNLAAEDRAARNMDTDVFFSYRRADTAAATQSIAQEVARTYRVFRDAETILGGADFDHIIRQSLAESRIVVVVIGPTWANARGTDGTRRLDNPQDYVRLELATALRMGKVIIPVLVNGARMPTLQELPPDLRSLATLRPLAISDSSQPAQVQPLLAILRETLRAQIITPLQVVTRAIGLWSIATGFLVVIEAAGFFGQIAYALGLCRFTTAWLGATDCSPHALPLGASSSASPLFQNLTFSGIVLFLVAWGIALFVAGTRRQWGWLRRNGWIFLVGIATVLWLYVIFAVQISYYQDKTTITPIQYFVTVLLITIGALSLRILSRYSRGIQRIRYTSLAQAGQ